MLILKIVLLIKLVAVAFTTGFKAHQHMPMDDLTSDELRQTFGVLRSEHVPKHEQLLPQASFHPDGRLERLVIDLERQLHELDFYSVTDDLISREMITVYRHGDDDRGDLRVDEKPTDCHFHHKSNQTYAAVSTCDGNLKGVIVKPWGAYVLHPMPERHQQRFKRSGDSVGLHVLYKREVADAPEQEFCGIKSTITSQELEEDESAIHEDVFVVGERLTQESELVVELAIFIDSILWAQFQSKHAGAAEQKLQDYALTMLNNIQIMYHQPSMTPKLHFKVVRYEVLQQQPSELHGGRHSNGHAQTYLDVFCKYQRKIGSKNWDHALMLSGYDLHRGYGSKSISGIARLFGMCDAGNTCTLAEGLDFTSAFIGTHELGHSVGMRHDEPYCTSSHIMSASLGPGKVTWSQCSMRDYHTYIEKLDNRKTNCLRTSSIPEVKRLDGKAQPGQVYDADKQCELMHGRGYKQVTPRQDNYDGICYMMWCGQTEFGRIITSHPALEGTFCGESKWCKLGRCVAWSDSSATAAPSGVQQTRPPPVVPQAVNGGWSAWPSVTCSACSCSPFAGGLGVLPSKRTCSRPAPLNGGRQCEGSDKMAIVCAKECASSGQSIDDYISSVCAKHRSTKNDDELTGAGTQLTRYSQRACKVFCDVKSQFGAQRNYRFFGDNLPDGTPCGGKRSDRFCLDGECLPLSCDEKALVHGDVGCPSQACPLTGKAQPATLHDPVSSDSGSWSQWSAWSGCSATCGGGTKRRGRSCTPAGRCEGNKEETESCNSNACATNAWMEWGTWTVCSVTCGSGQRSRARYCSGSQCPGARTEQEECSGGLCPWGNWGACSAQCGGGIRRRARVCPSGGCDSADSHEDAKCNQHDCDTWSTWGAWSSCSVSCGPGIQTRIRSCPSDLCDGSSNERKTCNVGACSDETRAVGSGGKGWTSWSTWGACSSSCGEGKRRRRRACHSADGNCSGEEVDTVVCETGPCANWGGWGYWSECSTTCGSDGIRRRVRKCYGDGPCAGENYEHKTCPGTAC